MTSSAKKRKEKRKDFQKTQLRVGKAKPKPSNYTDTSFKAKSIVVQAQSLSVDAPAASSQFAHHVTMLKNRSDSQRAESLAFLTTVIARRSQNAPLPESTASLLPKLQPLLLDTSPKVRQQLLKLLQCLPKEDIRSQAERFLLYLHAAMTTLHSDIRIYSIDILEWLMDCAGQEVVSCAGGWIKTLACFQTLLGWQGPHDDSNGWSSHQMPKIRPGAESKVVKRQLLALTRFLEVGLGLAYRGDNAFEQTGTSFPLHSVRQHLLPERSNAFSHLNVFGASGEDDMRMIEDAEGRQRVFAQRFVTPFEQGIANTVREGGELGRAAAQLRKSVEKAMVGYEQEKAPWL